MWYAFLEGYCSIRPITPANFEAAHHFVIVRHFWLMGEYASRAPEWGSEAVGWIAGETNSCGHGKPNPRGPAYYDAHAFLTISDYHGAAGMTFEEAMNYALTLPGTERSTSYRQPCVKANGNGFLFVGHEQQEAFALHVDKDVKPILLETHPETFFETAHYAGYPIVLVRFEGSDENLVRDMIGRAADRVRAKPPPRPRRNA